VLPCDARGPASGMALRKGVATAATRPRSVGG
jgi:hypothetical protein